MSEARTTRAVIRALAAETRRHGSDIAGGRVSRIVFEARISREGSVRVRPAHLGRRNLQSPGESV